MTRISPSASLTSTFGRCAQKGMCPLVFGHTLSGSLFKSRGRLNTRDIFNLPSSIDVQSYGRERMNAYAQMVYGAISSVTSAEGHNPGYLGRNLSHSYSS